MAQKLGELFTQIAAMAGITATDPRLKDIQSIMTEVPDDLLTEINGKIVSIEGAKNNATLKSYFTARALNPIDEILEEKLADAGFSDAEIAAIKADTSTPKKLRAFIDELKKKSAASPKGDAAVKAQIEELQKALSEKDASMKATISEIQSKADRDIFEYAENSVLSALPLIGKDVDADAALHTAKYYIQRELANIKAKAIREKDNSFRLVQMDNPDMDYYNAQHQKLNYHDFIKSTLAARKMLTNSDPANPPAPGTNPKFIPPAPGGTDNVALKEAIKSAKAAYTNGSSVVQGN